MTQDIMGAVRAGDAERVRELIHGNPDLVNTRDGAGNSPVLTAVYYNSPEVAELLIEQGATLDIYEAAATGRVERVRELVDANASFISSYSHDGWTPLHLAAFFGHREVAEHLLDRGADLHAVSKNGMSNTPLHAAVANGKREVVELLLSRGADPNGVARGWTPLHLAAQNGDVALAELFLVHGADPNPASEPGKSPLALARAEGHEAVAVLLQQHGATG